MPGRPGGRSGCRRRSALRARPAGKENLSDTCPLSPSVSAAGDREKAPGVGARDGSVVWQWRRSWPRG